MGVKIVTLGEGVIVQFPATHGRSLVAFRHGRLVASDDRCAHRGGPVHLSYEGEDGCLRCPWHDRPVKRDRPSRDLSAVHLASSDTLKLVAVVPGGREWPLRALTVEPREGHGSPPAAPPQGAWSDRLN